MLKTKPYLNKNEQLNLLINRGMIISDKNYALRKLSQISYYHLSGFWYTCRELKINTESKIIEICPITKYPIRLDTFSKNTNFDEIIKLYIFDKKLRLLILDAIERIEIYLRNVISNTLAKYDTQAYNNKKFIRPSALENKYINKKTNLKESDWDRYLKKTQNHIENQKNEDFIIWHNKREQSLPFWVLVETWDFGTLSTYFSFLNNSLQNEICKQIEINKRKNLVNWLKQIQFLRNRCAHHQRIWNKNFNNKIGFLDDNLYFNNMKINGTSEAEYRIFGLISVINFFLNKICLNSNWINKIINLINIEFPKNLPNCNLYSMGINTENKLDISIFTI